MKICPQDEGGCGSLVHASVRQCPDCGYEFPIDDTPKISARAEDVPMLSKGEATWRTVDARRFDFHEGKGDKPPSVKVTYTCGMTQLREWLCPQHSGYAKSKANKWWLSHGGLRPFPSDVLEWLERQRELLETAEISVRPDGKYWSVVDVRPGTERQHHANDNGRVAAMKVAANDNDNMSAGLREVLDDEIPF